MLLGFWAYRSKPYKNCMHTARQPSSIRKTMMHSLQLYGTCIESTYIHDIALLHCCYYNAFIL